MRRAGYGVGTEKITFGIELISLCLQTSEILALVINSQLQHTKM